MNSTNAESNASDDFNDSDDAFVFKSPVTLKRKLKPISPKTKKRSKSALSKNPSIPSTRSKKATLNKSAPTATNVNRYASNNVKAHSSFSPYFTNSFDKPVNDKLNPPDDQPSEGIYSEEVEACTYNEQTELTVDVDENTQAGAETPMSEKSTDAAGAPIIPKVVKLICPLCQKSFDKSPQHVSHMKQCAKKKKIPTAELLRMIEGANGKESNSANPENPEHRVNVPASEKPADDSETAYELALAAAISMSISSSTAGPSTSTVDKRILDSQRSTLERFGFTSSSKATAGPRKRKIKRAGPPILHTRTAEERTRLLTEKAAVILLSHEENADKPLKPRRMASQITSQFPYVTQSNKLWDLGEAESATWYLNELKPYISPDDTCVDCDSEEQTLPASPQEELDDVNEVMETVPPSDGQCGSLADDWSSLVGKTEWSDAVVETLDGSVPVHSLVLKVRCRGFAVEKLVGPCQTVTSSTLLATLDFIYTGRRVRAEDCDLDDALSIAQVFGRKDLIANISELINANISNNYLGSIKSAQGEGGFNIAKPCEEIEKNCNTRRDSLSTADTVPAYLSESVSRDMSCKEQCIATSLDVADTVRANVHSSLKISPVKSRSGGEPFADKGDTEVDIRMQRYIDDSLENVTNRSIQRDFFNHTADKSQKYSKPKIFEASNASNESPEVICFDETNAKRRTTDQLNIDSVADSLATADTIPAISHEVSHSSQRYSTPLAHGDIGFSKPKKSRSLNINLLESVGEIGASIPKKSKSLDMNRLEEFTDSLATADTVPALPHDVMSSTKRGDSSLNVEVYLSNGKKNSLIDGDSLATADTAPATAPEVNFTQRAGSPLNYSDKVCFLNGPEKSTSENKKEQVSDCLAIADTAPVDDSEVIHSSQKNYVTDEIRSIDRALPDEESEIVLATERNSLSVPVEHSLWPIIAPDIDNFDAHFANHQSHESYKFATEKEVLQMSSKESARDDMVNLSSDDDDLFGNCDRALATSAAPSMLRPFFQDTEAESSEYKSLLDGVEQVPDMSGRDSEIRIVSIPPKSDPEVVLLSSDDEETPENVTPTPPHQASYSKPVIMTPQRNEKTPSPICSPMSSPSATPQLGRGTPDSPFPANEVFWDPPENDVNDVMIDYPASSSQSLVTTECLRTPRKVLSNSDQNIAALNSPEDTALLEKTPRTTHARSEIKGFKTRRSLIHSKDRRSGRANSLLRGRRKSLTHGPKRPLRSSQKYMLSNSVINALNEPFFEEQSNIPNAINTPITPSLNARPFVEVTPCITPSTKMVDNPTPRPQFSAMKTGSIKKQLRRYGLKQSLSKVKAKKILKHFYDELHPIVNTTTGKLVKFLPGTENAPNGRNKKETGVKMTARKRKNSGLPQATQKQHKPATSNCPIDQLPSTSDAAELDFTTDDDYTDHSEGAEESGLSEDELLSQSSGKTMPLADAVRKYFDDHPGVYTDVLCYKPIWIETFKKDLQSHFNMRFNLATLKEYLDSQCIIFRSEAQAAASRKRYERKVDCKNRRALKKKVDSV